MKTAPPASSAARPATCGRSPAAAPPATRASAKTWHDMTGGNYWMPEAILYLDGLGKLRLGGGLTPLQINALNAGRQRAMAHLNWRPP